MRIEYTIQLNKGKFAGQKRIFLTTIEELECEGLSMLVIQNGYLDYWVNENEFEVIERRFFKSEDKEN